MKREISLIRLFSPFFIRLILYISLIGCATNAFAEEPLVLSLKEAIALSLRFNPSVQSGEIQRIVDKVSLRFAEWAYQPQYTLTGAVNYTKTVSNGFNTISDTQQITPGTTLLTPIGTQLSVQFPSNFSHNAGSARFYNPALTFSVVQPLLQGFGTDVVLAPLHQAQNQELLNRLTLKNTIMQNLTTVISQYAAVAQAQNSLEAQRLSLKNSIDTLKQQQEYLKAGRIADADLVQFQASAASQELALQQQEVNLQQQLRQFLIVLGIDPTTQIIVSKQVDFINDSLPTLTECIRQALLGNIAYQQQLINLKQAKINLLLANNQQRWQLNLTATRTQGGGTGGAPNSGLSSLTNGSDSNTTAALALSVPIDNVGLEKILVQAKVALKQQYITLDAQKRQVVNDVTNAYNTVLNQKGQIIQAKMAMDLAQRSLEISIAKLKFGKVSSFEVSTLQTNLVTQQLSYINAKTAYVTNLATLDQLIGNTLERWRIQLTY